MNTNVCSKLLTKPVKWGTATCSGHLYKSPKRAINETIQSNNNPHYSCVPIGMLPSYNTMSLWNIMIS